MCLRQKLLVKHSNGFRLKYITYLREKGGEGVNVGINIIPAWISVENHAVSSESNTILKGLGGVPEEESIFQNLIFEMLNQNKSSLEEQTIVQLETDAIRSVDLSNLISNFSFIGGNISKNILGSSQFIHSNELALDESNEASLLEEIKTKKTEIVENLEEDLMNLEHGDGFAVLCMPVTDQQSGFIKVNEKGTYDNSNLIRVAKAGNTENQTSNQNSVQNAPKTDHEIISRQIGIHENIIHDTTLKDMEMKRQNMSMETSVDLKGTTENNLSYRAETHSIVLNTETSGIGTQNQGPEKLVPYGEIGQEILSKLEKKGPMEFQLQLEPKDLGQIDIKLKLNEGKLMIDIMAASSKTQSLLTSQVDKLIQSMGLQNVQVESIQIYQQNSQQSQDNSQGYAMNAGMNFSQKRQQDQMQQQFMNQRNLGNILDLKNDEMLNSVNGIRQLRDNSHRMDYAV